MSNQHSIPDSIALLILARSALEYQQTQYATKSAQYTDHRNHGNNSASATSVSPILSPRVKQTLLEPVELIKQSLFLRRADTTVRHERWSTAYSLLLLWGGRKDVTITKVRETALTGMVGEAEQAGLWVDLKTVDPGMVYGNFARARHGKLLSVLTGCISLDHLMTWFLRPEGVNAPGLAGLQS